MNNRRAMLVLSILLFGAAYCHPDEARTLAVLDVVGDERLPASDVRLVSSQLVETVYRLGKANYKLIAVDKRNELLREIEFSLSDLSDAGQLKKLGHMLSADLIVSSKVGSKNPGYYLDTTLISVQTSEIVANSMKYVESFADLLQKAIPEIVCEVLSLQCGMLSARKSEKIATIKTIEEFKLKEISIADPTIAGGIRYIKLTDLRALLSPDSILNVIEENNITYVVMQGSIIDEFLNKKYDIRQIGIIDDSVSFIGDYIIWNLGIEAKSQGVILIRVYGAYHRALFQLLNRVDINIDNTISSFSGISRTMTSASWHQNGYMAEIKLQLKEEVLKKIRNANKVMLRIYLGTQSKVDAHITIRLTPECLRIF